MGLIRTKGNMYEFITHTWSPIKGKCWHDCSYCYMKKWGELPPIHLDEKELKADLGKDNFIFVCSGCDMFADEIPTNWISQVIFKTNTLNGNKYLFQTKNPARYNQYFFSSDCIFCVTIETNRLYPTIMKNSPIPANRIHAITKRNYGIDYITIEPIMDFDLLYFIMLLEICKPKQINIGADSKGHNLPEPPKEKVLELISELKKFTKVHLKKNLNRLING